MAGGSFDCTTYSEETYIVDTSVAGAYGNDGGVGWNTSASTMDGCDGRGSSCGQPMDATNEDAWNMKDGGGGQL